MPETCMSNIAGMHQCHLRLINQRRLNSRALLPIVTRILRQSTIDWPRNVHSCVRTCHARLYHHWETQPYTLGSCRWGLWNKHSRSEKRQLLQHFYDQQRLRICISCCHRMFHLNVKMFQCVKMKIGVNHYLYSSKYSREMLF